MERTYNVYVGDNMFIEAINSLASGLFPSGGVTWGYLLINIVSREEYRLESIINDGIGILHK